jgi:D-aminoacyl-tRNA deacylase
MAGIVRGGPGIRWRVIVGWMRVLLQRASRAQVRVDESLVGRIGQGSVVFVGVGPNDDDATSVAMARRIAELRIFPDAAGRTNQSLIDIAGEALVVSQFTLYADTRRGRRPGFTGAAEPALAERCYERFVSALREHGITVATGRFGAAMAVELINDGPFTIWLDTEAGGKPGG